MADPLFKQGGYAPLVLPAVADWPTATPADVGLDARRVDKAIAYHRAHETRWRPDFITERGVFVGVADEPERAGGVLGPIRPRGGPSGLIVRGGRLIAEWGESERVEMSFSIAKSYLAALAGVAVARGLIRGIDDPVCDSAIDDAFDLPQNQPITWRQLLQQTSEWSGTMFGKPDTIDHNRDLGKADFGQTDKGVPRPMRPPGTLWEYNDVRVNRLSLSLLQLFRSPLADVLRDAIMAPIGASSTWEWRPYANAWVEIDGRQMPSVPGGSHWAAASGCPRAITRASACCTCVAAAGATRRSCRHRGSTSAASRARSTRSTACCGGSMSGGPARGPRAAPAAASSGSVPTTISSPSCART